MVGTPRYNGLARPQCVEQDIKFIKIVLIKLVIFTFVKYHCMMSWQVFIMTCEG